MAIVKTREFNEKFLYDLSSLAIYKKEYLKSIDIWRRQNKLETIKHGNQPSKRVKFFGSYLNKKNGDQITDIDVIFVVDTFKSIIPVSKYNREERENPLYTRLFQIFTHLEYTNFIFLRFYCGNISGLEYPWEISENGGCKFNIENFDKWIVNLKNNHTHLYEMIKIYVEKDSLSMYDIINISKILEPHVSLNWTKNELINGVKYHNGLKYLLKDVMLTYKRQSRVMKFLYKYKSKTCLVDVNFATYDDSFKRNEIDIISYYIDDIYKKYKYLKKMLPPEIEEYYLQDRKKEIGQYTPLLGYLEMIEKIKKYNVLPDYNIRQLDEEAIFMGKQLGLVNVNVSEIKGIVLQKVVLLHEKYKDLVYEKYKPILYLTEIRRREITEQVSKEVIKKREQTGYDCSLFSIDKEQILFLYKKGLDAKINPYTLYDCLNIVSKEKNIPLKKVVECLSTESFNDTEKYSDKDLKIKILFGNKMI